MKKYRCLWCMSTTNHNRLYFLCVPCILLLNTGNWLWKAPKALARRGLGDPIPLRIGCNGDIAGLSVCTNKASPGRGQAQEAGMVQIGGWDVEKWRNRPKPAGGSDRQSGHHAEVPRGRIARRRRVDLYCSKWIFAGIICWWRTRTIRIPPGSVRKNTTCFPCSCLRRPALTESQARPMPEFLARTSKQARRP